MSTQSPDSNQPDPTRVQAPEAPRVPFGFLAQLWPYLRRYRGIMTGAAAALILTSLLTLALGQGVRLVIDQGILAESIGALNRTLGLVMVLVVAMAVGTFIRFYLVTWLGERVSNDLRADVFSHLVHMHPSYFEENKSGEIMSRLTTDTTLLQSIIGSSLSFALRNLLTVTGGLIMLLVTNLKLSGVVLLGVPAILIPVLWMGRRVRTLSRRSQDTVADVGTYAGEIIRQIKTVQSYARESFEKAAFQREVDEALNVARQRIRQRSILMAVVILLAFTAIAAMVWVGGYDVMTGQMTGGELAAFVFYAVMVAFGVAGVSEVYGEVQRAAGATERLIELLAEPSLITSPAEPEAVNADSPVHLSLRDVTFSYPSRLDRPALDGVTLDIRRGETVALVGPSGAGKSTLFELLLRFYDPQQGTIELLGRDVRRVTLDALREHMALVPQQPVLFSNDVWHNIRYGRPDAPDQAVIDAARAANAYDFIQDLPDGFNSDLGESGVRLSGGQKQRLVIARAILKDPDILLLDEATSALDAESEFQVQRALDKLMKNRTTLIIAHRLSTVLGADRIVVMDQGRVIAEGSHQELQRNSPLYRRLAELQFGERLETVDD
ncbi:ABC transporter transmembrane domain-containing protein [Saccharospirillum salsuginis]|uniref:ABC transporter ATP-binding protein n=1 Tax=Saccharospirillum salsuginis TaxID=418750 RepID=A0A918KDT1_9GAMM|nr:ABC transporter transmembrane domain-containing protein [Saccharospirillum salsuginis]GGX59635.1 ABC transporter ATP-binding protein [Saccharospirillum salsuginis]